MWYNIAMEEKNNQEKINIAEKFDLKDFEAPIHEDPGLKKSIPEKSDNAFENEKTLEDLVEEDGKTNAEIASPTSIVSQSQSRFQHEKELKEIENILADGLEGLYIKMDPVQRSQFKQAGENATRTIKDILNNGRNSARKIMDVIKKWLSMIPGVNNFFLEQEAKIKTDKILKLHNTI